MDACISFQDLKIYFLHFENESYTHHFFELFSHEGKIVAEQGRNLYFYRAGENPELPGYKMLKNKGVDLGSDINKYQFNVAIELRIILISYHLTCVQVKKQFKIRSRFLRY